MAGEELEPGLYEWDIMDIDAHDGQGYTRIRTDMVKVVTGGGTEATITLRDDGTIEVRCVGDKLPMLAVIPESANVIRIRTEQR